MAENKINIFWDDEAHSIIRMEFAPGWLWDEFYVAYNEANRWIDVSPHPVSFISIQTIQQVYLPPNTVSHMGSLLKTRRPNHGISVVVATNNLMKGVGNTVLTLYPYGRGIYHFASSPEEAREIIAHYQEQTAHQINSR